MENTMVSIVKYILTNLGAFGLSDSKELQLIERPKVKLPDGSKRLTVLGLRTLPDNTKGVPFGNLLASGVQGERFLTLVEIECKCRAPDPGMDYFWNDVRRLRDKAYNALAGPNRGGLVVPRFDWTYRENPIPAGEIWFEVDPGRSTPTEDLLEDPADAANKSIFLTYNVHWWQPV